MINSDSLKKAVQSLKEAIDLYDNYKGSPEVALAFRDAVIQRFEYTYELSWKLMKRWIKENSTITDAEPITRKQLYRNAAKLGLIDNPEDWLVYHSARNLVSHTYNESNAIETFEAAVKFVCDAQRLLDVLSSED